MIAFVRDHFIGTRLLCEREMYVPVPIVHAGSKSMVYVCESACVTAVDLARDDIVIGDRSNSLFCNGKGRFKVMFQASLGMRLAHSSLTGREPRHSATATITIPFLSPTCKQTSA